MVLLVCQSLNGSSRNSEEEEERPLPVVLIDEYHAPAQKFPKDAEKREAMFTVYRHFYGVLKSQRRHLHAAFLTGILRAEIGGSSGANHVKDVTHHPALSGACGFTLEEIRAYCRPWLVEMAAKRCGAADSSTAGDVCWARLTEEQRSAEVEKVVKEMQALYDGYHFSVDCETSCYNPFGLVRCFNDKEFGSNWARSFDSYSSEVIQRLRDAERQRVEQGVVCEKELLSATVLAEKSDANHVAALLQSGYLTIAKGVSDEVLLLRLPNGEVKHAFCGACYRAWKGISDHNAWKELSELHDALTNGDVRSIMAAIGRSFELGPQPSGPCGGEERASAAVEDSPRDGWGEDRFRGYLRVVFGAVDVRVVVENIVSAGIAHWTVKAGRYRYIFELKVKELSSRNTAGTALQQAQRYASQTPEPGLSTVAVGIVFSQWTRNVCDWASLNMSTGEELRMDKKDVRSLQGDIDTERRNRKRRRRRARSSGGTKQAKGATKKRKAKE
eukprot:gene6580-biopygen4183